jgi:hypothetical protein
MLINPNNHKSTCYDKFHIPDMKGNDKKGYYCNIEMKPSNWLFYNGDALNCWIKLYNNQ